MLKMPIFQADLAYNSIPTDASPDHRTRQDNFIIFVK
jgi:hypothetical protein